MATKDRRPERAHSDIAGKIDWGASVLLEGERRLLGLLLARGDTFEAVAGLVTDREFYEPLHRRIYRLLVASREKGVAFSRARLESLLAIDKAFREHGGASYLDQMAADATLAEIEGQDVMELATLVRDLFVRREVIAACRDIAVEARGDAIRSGADLRSMLEGKLMAFDYQAGSTRLVTLAEGSLTVRKTATAGGVALLSTGFTKIDKRLGKLECGDLGIIAGRPSMGKSALAGVIALNMARKGLGVIEINGEMSVEQMTRRHLSDHGHRLFGDRAPYSSGIRAGNLTPEEDEKLAHVVAAFEHLPLVMLRKPKITLGEIFALVRRRKREWEEEGIGFGALIVDHMGLVASGSAYFQGATEEMTAVSGGLKAGAVDLGIVVIGLSQLSRQLEAREDKRPMLADLRQSGSIEQDADWVLACYREAYYAQREAEPKKEDKRMEWMRARGSQVMEAIALKVREGSSGTDNLWADVARNAVRDEMPASLGLFEDGDLKR